MIIRYVLWVLLAYFLYKFVFNFILPLFQATRQFKRQVNEFQNNMQQPPKETVDESNFSKKGSSASKTGDYIDFEEVKYEKKN